MGVTQQLNSKANVKKSTNSDLPFEPRQPVIASYGPVESTAGQTTIANLGFSVDQSNKEVFFLFVDGKKLSEGSSYDFTFTNIDSTNNSSSISFNTSLPSGLNIQAYKLGLKKESEFLTDNRFTQLYEAQDSGYQAFVASPKMTATTATGTPAAGTFHSTVVNRAQIVDLSQDLKARMGIDRMMIQQIVQLQNEFGPNGEIVWSTVNDTLGQIRLIGSFGPAATGFGFFAQSGTNTTDYIEVTFFGTGLNILNNLTGNGYDLRYSVDGGAESGNITLTNYASVLGNRNYTTNQVLPVVSGLTLGVHTVKIRQNASGSFGLQGIEILNESSSIKTNSGTGYIQGKKTTLAAQDVTSYTTGVTGVRGGRMITYLSSSGVNRSFQAVNASQANLSLADHTNEEITRTYSFREFGAGRFAANDDFSLITANSDRVFTLDDGTTTLVADDLGAGTLNGYEALSYQTGTSALTITFVGTGLDVFLSVTTAGTIPVLVNGSSIGTLTPAGNNTSRTYKIVSGLPYGTHVVKFTNTGVPSTFGLNKFSIYQPKKPIIPSGAIELADYNVMADFVANTTAARETRATGILRKFSIYREGLYTNGTGGTTDWAYGGLNPAYESGQSFSTNRTGATKRITFFGTGFDFRHVVNPGYGTAAISLNGIALNASYPSAASITVSTYGNGTYGGQAANTTFLLSAVANNNLVTAGTANLYAGFRVSGLPLGVYTFTLTKSDTNSMELGTFDIITPIHSAKPIAEYSLQSTLTVGSQSIMDSRKWTPIKDNHLQKKNISQAFGSTANPTTTSVTLVPLPDMSVVHTNTTGKIKITFSVRSGNSNATSTNSFNAKIDGIDIFPNDKTFQAFANNAVGMVTDSIVINVTPGTHKIEVTWAINTGTATAIGVARTLIVEEI